VFIAFPVIVTGWKSDPIDLSVLDPSARLLGADHVECFISGRSEERHAAGDLVLASFILDTGTMVTGVVFSEVYGQAGLKVFCCKFCVAIHAGVICFY